MESHSGLGLDEIRTESLVNEDIWLEVVFDYDRATLVQFGAGRSSSSAHGLTRTASTSGRRHVPAYVP